MTTSAPAFKSQAFTCPFCQAYAHMAWMDLYTPSQRGGFGPTDILQAMCTHCQCMSYWLSDGSQIFPMENSAPLPHADMPASPRADFEEARRISMASPRAAAGLLRLAVQKLCVELGEPGNNINEDIGSLVKKGLPVRMQKALDVVRVVGNNAVHPGEISADDVAAVSTSLFNLVNFIVEDRISKPRQLDEMFGNLPAGALAAIARRDGQSQS